MSKSKLKRAAKPTDQQRRDEILIRAFELVDTFNDGCNLANGSTCSTSNNDCIADVLLSIDLTSNPALAKRVLIAIVDTVPVDAIAPMSDQISKAMSTHNWVRRDLARDDYKSVRRQLAAAKVQP